MAARTGTCEHCHQGPMMCDCCPNGCLYAASLHCDKCGLCECQGDCKPVRRVRRAAKPRTAESLGIIIP
jgi:hypothetical protein